MYLRVHVKLKQQKGRVKVLNVPICAIPPLAKPSMQVLYERVLRRPYPPGQRHVYIGMSLQKRPSKSLHMPLAYHSCLFLALFLSSVPPNLDVCHLFGKCPSVRELLAQLSPPFFSSISVLRLTWDQSYCLLLVSSVLWLLLPVLLIL